MKCKYCKRTIEDNSIFCNWCGKRQVVNAKEIKVPVPRQLPSGSWFAQVTVDGVRVPITADTEKEYYTKARATKAGLIEKRSNPANATLDEVIAYYIKINEPVFSVSTVRGYETNRRQLQQFGSADMWVSGINWQQFVNKLAAKYAPKTVKNIWGLITPALRTKGIEVPEVNLPGLVKSEREFLEPEQITQFVSAVYGKRIELTALLALHSLRESEILAITKDSISNGIIHVRGAVVPDKNNKLVRQNRNKTHAGTRDIPVMIPRLQELWDQLEEDPHFPHPSNIRRDIMRIAEKANFPPITCHNLRHSFCSLAWYLQWDLKTTCALGGWENPAVPTEIYAHLTATKRNADVKSMQDFFNNSNC